MTLSGEEHLKLSDDQWVEIIQNTTFIFYSGQTFIRDNLKLLLSKCIGRGALRCEK
jgi:hypothetical protein